MPDGSIGGVTQQGFGSTFPSAGGARGGMPQIDDDLLQQFLSLIGGGGGGVGASSFLPFAAAQGAGIVGDLISTLFGGARQEQKESTAGFKTATAGLEAEAGKGFIDPFSVVPAVQSALRPQMKAEAERLQDISGNVFAPDVYGAFKEEFFDRAAGVPLNLLQQNARFVGEKKFSASQMQFRAAFDRYTRAFA